MKSYFDVWCMCMTNSGVSFPIFVGNVQAPSGIEAGMSVINHTLQHGTQIQLMAGGPKMPVSVVTCCPFNIAPSAPQVLQ